MSEPRRLTNSWELLHMIGQTDLPKAAKHLLFVGVAFLDCRTLQMRPSLGKLARYTGWSDRTLQRALDDHLIPRGVLTPQTPRRGGRKRGTGIGITTVYRLDLDALTRCQRADQNPDSLSGYDSSNPDNGAPEPRHPDASTPTPATEYPDTVSDKPQKNNQENNHPTTTGGGGAGVSLVHGLEAEAIAEGAALLRAFGASSERLIQRAARAHPTDLIRALIRHAEAEGIRAGLVLQMLTGKHPLPPIVETAVETGREARRREAAELDALRERLAALPPELLETASERAGVTADMGADDSLRAIGVALTAMGREEAEAAERERFETLWASLTPDEQIALRNRFQVHTMEELRRNAERTPRSRAAVFEFVHSLHSSPESDAEIPPVGTT